MPDGKFLLFNCRLSHEAAITFHISTEHRGEIAFKALFGHGITPLEVLVAGENQGNEVSAVE